MHNNQETRTIVIAAEIFPPDIGGPATYSAAIAHSLFHKGWNVKLICYSSVQAPGDYPFKVVRIQRSKVKYWHHIKYLIFLFFLSLKTNVIYAQGPVSSGRPAVLVGRILRKKIVIKVVGDYAWEQARNSGTTDISIDNFQDAETKGRIKILQKSERQSCRRADLVIVPSEYLKALVVGWGVPSERVKVIYNAVSEHTIEERARKPFLIVSIGRLVPWKGFHVLIEGMKKLHAHNPQARLVILGSGPLEEELRNNIQEKGLQSVITMREADPAERNRTLKTASVFALLTEYEGFSHTILEAMASGTPVITTAAGGNKEIIKDGENGIIVPIGNPESFVHAVLDIFNNPKLGERLIIGGKDAVSHFTHEAMVNKTERVLQSI